MTWVLGINNRWKFFVWFALRIIISFKSNFAHASVQTLLAMAMLGLGISNQFWHWAGQCCSLTLAHAQFLGITQFKLEWVRISCPITVDLIGLFKSLSAQLRVWFQQVGMCLRYCSLCFCSMLLLGYVWSVVWLVLTLALCGFVSMLTMAAVLSSRQVCYFPYFRFETCAYMDEVSDVTELEVFRRDMLWHQMIFFLPYWFLNAFQRTHGNNYMCTGTILHNWVEDVIGTNFVMHIYIY